MQTDRTPPRIRSRWLLSLLALFALGLAAGSARAARPALVSIRVLPQTASLVPGQVLALRAVGHFDDGSSADITKRVEFRDDGSPVARIDRNLVFARKPGEVEIRAAAGGISSTENLALSVSTIVALELDPTDVGIRLGDTVRLRARATLANGALRHTVTGLMRWSSSAPRVVQVDDRDRSKGIAKARSLGTATIEARDPETDVVASLPLTVVAQLSSVAVDPPERFLQLDDTTVLRAVGTFEGGIEAALSRGVVWASDDVAIARVDKLGGVTPRAFGTVEIRATEKKTGVSSDASGENGLVTVVGDLLELAIDPAADELAVGEVLRFRALGTFEHAAGSFRMGSRVDWFSSDPGIAVAEADGDVECVAPGEVAVSARDKKSGITSTESEQDAVLTCIAP
jgi:hypothetical protein